MGLGGGGKARAFAIAVALLLARCDLSPHPEDPGLTTGSGNSKGGPSRAADAGALINGTGGAPGAVPSSGAGGGGHDRPITAADAGESIADSGASRDGGNDSGAYVDSGSTADAADGR